MTETRREAVYRFGLTGWPLEHSLSPQIHAAALQAAGLQGAYQLFPVPPLPEGAGKMRQVFDRLHSRELDGINVTIPHKQAVLGLLDGLTEAAAAIGAVNLIYRIGERILGDNSDAPALLLDLETRFGLESQSGVALVLGAGGAARAAVYILLQQGWQVSVAARRFEAAQQLVADLNRRMKGKRNDPTAIPLNSDSLARVPACDLLVNATSVGMPLQVGKSPWPPGLQFPAGACVYDMIYNPSETLLIKTARAAGHRTSNGLGMLVEQAALSFERWTGRAASRQAMHSAASLSLDTIG